MDRQTVVAGIESIAKDIADFRKLSSIVNDFLAIPHSKKAMRVFAETYLLDNFLTAGEYNSLLSKLTVEETLFNSSVVRDTIYNSNSNFSQPLNKFKLKIKKCLGNVLLLIAEINNIIIEGPMPNKIELLDSLFNKVVKIESIFQTARQLPVEANQIDDLSVADTICCTGIADLITFEKNVFNNVIANLDLGKLLEIGSNSTYVVDPYLCKNNWLSLRNLIISLHDI